MIAFVEGRLEEKGLDWAVVRIGGVGIRVQIPSSTLEALGDQGQPVRLHTHLHVREDNLALYGFHTQEGLRLFQLLITVDGVGPRVALNILSTMVPDQAASAIASGDVDALTRVPGIGKKTAARLVLELKGKLEREWGQMAPVTAPTEDTDVSAALLALGYSAAEVRRAVAALGNTQGVSLEDRVRTALQALASQP